ncbi:salviol synthase-like [Andrographis paniculata]|uniref:salviol synthase-like n=1 Tax=Andrographis paniculata TaxID=175694 RepID=UPI0021E70FF6|nr:salviol synthase-like [Andrographis paniculata]
METTTIQLLILASFLFSILMIFKQAKKSRPNLPPGPPKLPLIGNLHNLIGGGMPHQAIHQLALKYGPLMHLKLGGVSTVVVSSPDVARQVMKTHDLNFASRPPLLATEILNYGKSGVIFSPYGESWRHLRKICTLELLSNKRVQSFRPVRQKVHLELARMIAAGEGSAVDLSSKLYSSTYDVASRVAVGESNKSRKARLMEIINEAGELSAGFHIAELYPSIKVLGKITGLEKKLQKLHWETDELLEGIIGDHREAPEKEDGKKVDDLVDVLLKLQGEEHQSFLTSNSIKSVIMDILGAGSETSATTLDWAMTELLKNPSVMDRAQREVRAVFDRKGHVNESDVNELKYLNSVIKETLRLHTPGPLLVPRMCIEACQINGCDIPENTRVIVNAWTINRDPDYWQDPLSFKPERFLDSAVDYGGDSFEYLPFGAGRRICPGISFGLANIQSPLAMLLYHFDWKLPDGMKPEDIDMSEKFGVTTRRLINLRAVPVITRPLP